MTTRLTDPRDRMANARAAKRNTATPELWRKTAERFHELFAKAVKSQGHTLTGLSEELQWGNLTVIPRHIREGKLAVPELLAVASLAGVDLNRLAHLARAQVLAEYDGDDTAEAANDAEAPHFDRPAVGRRPVQLEGVLAKYADLLPLGEETL